MTFGSLFAGIGGFDLGFERAGMTCKWQVEIDPYCQRVLAKHWPDVRRHDDVRTFPPTDADEWRVDVICGGFPCQDITSSGKRAGINGERSGLFFEIMRIVRVVRPRIVVLENVSDLLSRGMGTVLGELADVGMDAWWDCFPAAALGIPQRRFRTFIVAYAPSVGFTPDDEWLASRTRSHLGSHYDGLDEAERQYEACASVASRADDGIPRWMDRVRVCGNAVVPKVAEWIGRRLMEAAA
jgi:DNA (cytosine-5)-methyltransferase 1